MIRECKTRDDFDEILEASHSRPVFLFKHSTICPMSAVAWERFLEFSDIERRPLFGRVLVLEERALSNAVADTSGVEHHSPQVILFWGGRAADSQSHDSITSDNMRRMLSDIDT